VDDNPYRSPETKGEARPFSYGFENLHRSALRVALAILMLPFALAFGLLFFVGVADDDQHVLMVSAVPGVITAGLLFVISRIPR
jgi:hypothetical protein